MKAVEEIENAITTPSDGEVRRLSAWLEEYEAGPWDAQIEHDAQAGKLDFMHERARRAHAEGRTTPL